MRAQAEENGFPERVAHLLQASPYLARVLRGRGLAADAPATTHGLAAPGALAPASDGSGAAARAGLDWLATQAAGAWDRPRLQALLAAELAARKESGDLARMAAALRRVRPALLCGLMLRESAGEASLEEAGGAMSAFADLAVASLLPLIAAGAGQAIDADGLAQDLLVIAMGKGGAGELNVSSDLDLILVHGEAQVLRQPDGREAGPDAVHAHFQRVARALVRALDEVDAEGFVFRTDLRLRPHGDAGPLVISLPMLEEYLLREGRAWERFAWAKARVIEAPAQADAAGHARQREALREIVEPFVFRRYLDFGTIDAVADLHRRIGTASRARALRAGAATDTDPDIKTGRGGIREVEFLVQMFCVMRGGREPALRAAGTLAGLAALGRLGLLGLEQVRALEADYRLLRRVEHALQYRDDAQTHRLPQDSAAWEAVAVLAGFGDGAALRAALDACRGRVQAAFDQAMPDTPATAGEAQGRRGAEALLRHGFAPEQAQDAARRLQDLLASPRVAAMGPAGQTLVAGLADQALEWIATAGSGGGPLQAPERLLQRWIALVEVIGRRGTYFSLLAAYPRAHHSVLRLLATGGWASDYLMRHPILLDELIDGDSGAVQAREWAAIAELPGAAEPAWRDWANSLEARLAGFGDDEERQLNLLRDAHHAAVFRLLLADLSGQLPLERLADHLSALADAVIGVALRGAWRQLVPGGGEPPLAVIAYGKLGGRELGYASDLDLAFLVEEGAGEEFERAGTRLARRLVLWLTSATSSGQLFEVDLRLRPNGEAGLLVLPFAAFERYQRNADGHGAWTWEHQALTRARVCAGSAGLRASFDALREAILASDRDAPSLLESVQSMRARMLAGHPNRSGDFDIKHDRGGMVDVEFAVQALVLRHAARVPELLPNVGNLALLGRAARAGLLDTALAADAARAYRDYRGWQHAARLAGAERVRVPAGQAAVQRAAVGRLWDAVLAD